MAIQTTYPVARPAAFEGMIATQIPQTLVSRQIEDAAVGFGKALQQGTADNGAAAADGASDVYAGITCRSHEHESDQYAVGDSALVMLKGDIWVRAYDTVAAGAPVYVAVNNSSDKFTDTATSNMPIPRATFLDSGDADELVRIRLA